MSDDSFIKKFVGKVTDRVEEAFEAVGEGVQSAGEAIADTAKRIKARLVGMEVTFYPTYGYREGGEWLVPVRVWVHDNRDTPFVEDFIERKVRGRRAAGGDAGARRAESVGPARRRRPAAVNEASPGPKESQKREVSGNIPGAVSISPNIAAGFKENAFCIHRRGRRGYTRGPHGRHRG